MLYKNDTIDNASIGSFIRSARKMKGFTQEELAQALRIDSKYLSQVERGVSLPSYPLMVAFSDTRSAWNSLPEESKDQVNRSIKKRCSAFRRRKD